MKKLILAPLIFFCISVFGQSNLFVTGTVTDTATGKPIANAIVSLRCADTTVETHADAAGKYSFDDKSLKPDKLYILYAHTDSPMFGNAMGKEVYVSTYSLKNHHRRYIRNIQLVQNTVSEPPAPTGRIYFQLKNIRIANPGKDSVLNVWLQYLLNNPTYVVEISGHADRKDGRRKFRRMTSDARAQECIDYLHAQGVPYDQMKMVGYGSTQPAVDKKTIRHTKDKQAKLAERLLNCFAEMKLIYIFRKPPSVFTITGTVTDVNTGLPINRALLQFMGTDGTKFAVEADADGNYNMLVHDFNPLVYYILSAEAIGYDQCDSSVMPRFIPQGYDQLAYNYSFQIEKHGFETQPIFPPISFDSTSGVLTSTAKDTLNRLRSFMEKKPGLVMRFMGDADWHEPDYINLAMVRAQACVDYLVSLGIDRARFIVTSHLNPVAVKRADENTPGIIKHLEQKARFNRKACSVSFWPVNWYFDKK